MENTVESSEISQVMNEQPQYTEHTPQLGVISPEQQEKEGHTHTTPKSSEILPKELHQVTDLEAMEEAAVAKTPNEGTGGTRPRYSTHP